MRMSNIDTPVVTAARLGLRLVEQRFGRNAPLFASFFVTRQCNVRCDGCAYYENLDPAISSRDPSTADCLTIIRRLAEGGVPVVNIVGGEPMLRSDLHEILDFGSSLKLSMSVITNGIPGNEAALRSMDRSCTWVVFSPHVPAELAGHRQKEKYEKAWRGFRRIRQAVHGKRLVCNITVSRHTVPLMDELVQRSLDGGADSVKFQPNNEPDLFPAPESLASALSVIEKWRRRFPDRVVAPRGYMRLFDDFFGPEPLVACTATRRIHLGVHPDGIVSACCP
jgi:MoaA/NifB/PqqE/SkfB family radical SAM enzyme